MIGFLHYITCADIVMEKLTSICQTYKKRLVITLTGKGRLFFKINCTCALN